MQEILSENDLIPKKNKDVLTILNENYFDSNKHQI